MIRLRTSSLILSEDSLDADRVVIMVRASVRYKLQNVLLLVAVSLFQLTAIS